jgi:hemerythrin-like domain-containing protein
MAFDTGRRDLLCDSIRAGVAVISTALLSNDTFALNAQQSGAQEPEVTATEDLMREHGVIRRALLVYAEAAPKLRQSASSVNAAAIRQTAQLFRTFGEDYHEKMLEEQHIFPRIRKMSKPELTRYVDILISQHERGRQVTDYILAVSNAPRIGVANAEPLARAFESFYLMYANHAAREDTIIFPAWKTNFTNKQLDEISDEFEEIEHKMFGKDGFEAAEKRIGGIETELGFSDLAQFTPPPPPQVKP